MVEVENTEILNNLSEKTKISNTATLPRILNNSIQPVIEVGQNIDEYFIENGASTTTANTVIFTTPANKDFYLTFAVLSLAKDNVSDNVISYVQAVINGITTRIISIGSLTTTEIHQTIGIGFHPIKLDRNSAITVVGSTTGGVIRKDASIMGFSVDTLEK